MTTPNPIIYVSPELEQLRQLVSQARARLVELETDYTKEKSRVDVVQAALFRLLREHYQKRDRLRLTVDYRRKLLDSLTRGDAEEAKHAEKLSMHPVYQIAWCSATLVVSLVRR